MDILDNHLWPGIAQHFPANSYVFQDDNAPVHRAGVVKEYKHAKNIRDMIWPAQSPDINIIENCWHRKNDPKSSRRNHNPRSAVRNHTE